MFKYLFFTMSMLMVCDVFSDLAHIGDRIALRASWMTDKQDDHFYLMIYWILAGINAAVSLIRAFSFAYGGIFAAVGLHNNLLNSILKVNFSYLVLSTLKDFFDNTFIMYLQV